MNIIFRKTIRQITVACIALLTLALPNEIRAQFTGDNQTNIISGVTSNRVGNYYVGFQNVFDTLLIQNSGVLSNAGGYIGYNVGANSNTTIVSGSGSTWSNGAALYVGFSGAGNNLVISNGGAVFNAGAVEFNGNMIGKDTSASNNSVRVTGSGSMLVNPTNLTVGNLGSANSLVISNGGAVLSGRCYVGLSGKNNSVLVAGTGSWWSNRQGFVVGGGGASNRLVVSDGGNVIANGITVGDGGMGNSLIISNGGTVANGGYCSVGYSGTGATNNLLLVTGNGSVLSNSNDLTIGYGASGFGGAGNSLVISNGGKVVNANADVGGNYVASNNTVVVTGPGSVWLNTFNYLFIGSAGSGNRLEIRDGGTVVNNYAYVGGGPTDGGSNNTVLVTGSGSLWSNRSSFRISYFFPGNSLIISNGGTVVGTAFVSTKGSIRVTDEGSVWKSNGDISFASSNGELTITNHGSVTATRLSLGVYSYNASNRVNISGGNLWVTNPNFPSYFRGLLDVFAGTLALESGTVTADLLSLTNGPAGVIAFNGGTLNSAGTVVANTKQFVIGNGTNSATFHLLTDAYGSSFHSFNDSLRIRTNSFLTGCGMINGNVLVDAGGTVLADGCGTLTFTGNVTNSGVMIADNGSILESSGTLVNNGKIFLLRGGTTNFTGTFINNGMIVDGNSIRLNPQRLSNQLVLSWTNAGFSLQSAPDPGASFTNILGATSPYTNPAAAPQQLFRLKMN